MNTYYILATDNYGQPSGCIYEKQLTPAEAEKIPYCFSSYESALRRALD